MKQIKLNHGFVALVDDEDYEYLKKSKWAVFKSGAKYYARRGRYKGRETFMHRVVLNIPKDKFIDHIDRDGLNNQKYNLRECSHAQNMANRTPCGVSLFLGVCPKRDKWRAQITKNNKVYYLGTFDTEQEAAYAYNKKALEFHGDFANINKL